MDERAKLRRTLAIAKERAPAAVDFVMCSCATTEIVSALLDAVTAPESLAALERDPYWPKWDGPWWRMMLLFELGVAELIPSQVIEALADGVEGTYLPTFPLVEEELPPGLDPYREIICHCALGCLYQLFRAVSYDVDGRFPWMRSWFVEFQLADGGLNCDEAVYTRPRPRSSFLSTLPPLEAMVNLSDLTGEERWFLAHGAQYLQSRSLCCSISKGGAIIDRSWLEPCFPRYYHYDVLRGLAFLVRWATMAKETLSARAIAPAVVALATAAEKDAHGCLSPRKRSLIDEGSLVVGSSSIESSSAKDDSVTWQWSEEASLFPELTWANDERRPSRPLTEQWYGLVAELMRLDEAGLLHND